MKSDQLQRRVLQLLASGDNRLTLARAVLEMDQPAERLQRELDQMLDAGLLELDSLDDGTLYYHAPGLRLPAPAGDSAALIPTAEQQSALALKPQPPGGVMPRTRAGKALGTFTVLSVLDLLGTGLAALLVLPHWEAEVLMWIALGGAPGTLLGITWLIHRKLFGGGRSKRNLQ